MGLYCIFAAITKALCCAADLRLCCKNRFSYNMAQFGVAEPIVSEINKIYRSVCKYFFSQGPHVHLDGV